MLGKTIAEAIMTLWKLTLQKSNLIDPTRPVANNQNDVKMDKVEED